MYMNAFQEKCKILMEKQVPVTTVLDNKNYYGKLRVFF